MNDFVALLIAVAAFVAAAHAGGALMLNRTPTGNATLAVAAIQPAFDVDSRCRIR